NVMAQYVEDNLPPFQIEDNEEESKTFWKWLEKHAQICQKWWFSSIHILQYADILKLPAYDAHCPSIPPEMHQRLCCTVCRKYFPTLRMVTTHKKSEHAKQKKHKKSVHTVLSNLLDDFSLNLISAAPEINNCGSVLDGE
ncbi:3851_t:CDS:2, partial [Gigaspora rosea]